MQQPESFAEVYQTYFPAAAGLARSLTRDHAAAEDIAAEGLLRVWRHWETGSITQPWGYVRKTVVNVTINRARKEAREHVATSRSHQPAPGGFEDAISDRDLVQRLLEQLPARQRQLVELRFLQDLPERETARRLGISVGAVKSGTSRGLARLRSHAADELEQVAA
jgi:RNA polymerase sigma factor (sigma-70 family)